MTSTSLVLVLAAAALHASWNALAKGGGDPLRFLWLSNCVASLALAPVAAVLLVRGALTTAGVPFVIGTALLHGLYFYALGRSYRTGQFSLVYPMARGLGVALVPVIALNAFGEHLSFVGVVGVCLVVLGIAGLNALPGVATAATSKTARLGSSTAWALLTGLSIAAYSVLDKAGSARVSPPLYLALMEAGTVLFVAPAVLSERERLGKEWDSNRAAILFAGVASPGAYLMVLFAFQMSKTGYVVAARELSIVFSALIGSLWLREGRLTPRLASACVILAGVVCVAVAR